MKVEQVEPKVRFKPVVITLETQNEVDELFMLFNYSPITSYTSLYNSLYNELERYRSSCAFNMEVWTDFVKKLRKG